VVDSCEQDNELLGSIKWWEFLEWLSDYIFEKGSAQFNKFVRLLSSECQNIVFSFP
jgi:hypothetical protein